MFQLYSLIRDAKRLYTNSFFSSLSLHFLRHILFCFFLNRFIFFFCYWTFTPVDNLRHKNRTWYFNNNEKKKPHGVHFCFFFFYENSLHQYTGVMLGELFYLDFGCRDRHDGATTNSGLSNRMPVIRILYIIRNTFTLVRLGRTYARTRRVVYGPSSHTGANGSDIAGEDDAHNRLCALNDTGGLTDKTATFYRPGGPPAYIFE